MKTQIVVEVETRDDDPDRCGDCEWSRPAVVCGYAWCHLHHEPVHDLLRCPACLDGEAKAKGGRK